MASAPPPASAKATSESSGAGQSADAAALPVHVLTGFLGSGKTTLLNRALKTARFGDAAVLINEFGEVAIDHLLVRETREELVLLASGCVCCTLRNDLIEALGSLLDQRARGEVPRFSRILLETTGLADPAAIIQTLVSHAALRDRVYLDGILCTVDAQLGARTLEAQASARRQVAVADRLLLTKRDLVDAVAIRALERQLASLNPRAERVWVAPEADAAALLSGTGHLDTREVLWTSKPRSAIQGPSTALPPADSAHLEGIGQVAVTLPRPVDFRRFSLWVSLITQMWAERLLRLKAVVSAEGEPGPIAIQAVQHVVYPPLDLPPIPALAGQSHVVVLIERLSERERREITDSLLALGA